jgi:hypothetical protein
MKHVIFTLGAALMLAGCSGSDPVTPSADDPPPSPLGPAVVQVLPLPENATSRRFDLQAVVADSGRGVDHIEVWARPAAESWQLALTTTDTTPTRFTVAETGPFGPWEFTARAVAPDGTHTALPETAMTFTNVPEPIYIVDQQGETWEITNAVLRYGMFGSAWEFGLGRWTIAALIDPPHAVPGDPDYPDPNNLAVVFGVHLADEARAYRLGDLNDREVVDDSIAGIPFAVTY